MAVWDLFRSSPLPRVERVLYSEIRHELDDLDLLLWSSRSFAGRFITAGQRIGLGRSGSWPSHVSTVLAPRTPTGGEKHVLNLESTTRSGKTPDVYTRRPRSGAQVNLLSARIARYRGRVYVRRLAPELRTPARVARLHEIRLETSGLTYERDPLEWIGAALRWLGPVEEDRSSLSCSELLAHVLQETGLLPRERPSNRYAPADFTTARWPEGIYGPELEILPG